VEEPSKEGFNVERFNVEELSKEGFNVEESV
jgi:hypothetical protein